MREVRVFLMLRLVVAGAVEVARFGEAVCSLGRHGLCHDRVEQAAEELEPLRELDLAITIGIESLEEVSNLGLALAHVDVANAELGLHGDLSKLILVDVAVTVQVELGESLAGGLEGLVAGGSDSLSV